MSTVATLPGKTTDLPANSQPARKFRNFAAGTTPLSRYLTADQTRWLTTHLCERWTTLNTNMTSWREKMAKWERMSEEDFSDRKDQRDQVNDSSVRDIFMDQNDTLGTIGGFYDFHFAQAKDDIFGTRPWLAVTPEGKDDIELADTMTKHAQWKFNQSDLEQALIDALKVSTWGGTAFVKAGYRKDVEKIRRVANVAVSTATGQPFFKGVDEAGNPALVEAGEYIETAEELASFGISDEENVWKQMDVEDVVTNYHNVESALVDYKNIAFETTAPLLTLRHTDVFVKFKMGLIDVMSKYGIPESRRRELIGALMGESDETRDHREESEPADASVAAEENTNPLVTLVEGFVRCAPAGGETIQIHAIFSPDLNAIFRLDYLANVTPGAILPVFPVRINKIPGRIFGKGYFEKYENPNNAIDRQYNLITYRNRPNAHVWTTFQPEALADWQEGKNLVLDPNVPLQLAPGKTIQDLIQFATAPDTNGRAENLLNSMLQMIQMRSGITSAAQGELKGVPSANTATGTRDLMSRGATLVKCPITEQQSDIRAIVEFATLLLYANQDLDETFTWAEGRETKLLTIEKDKVLGIRVNATLTLTQAQNREKLESAMAATDLVIKYISIPEIEKPAARPAFIQALSSLGFHNAEDIIRQAAVDPAGVLAMLPPDIAPVVEQAFVQAGLIAPPGGPESPPAAGQAAPVMAAA
ncbi:MAG: hypothetical protein LLG20_22585 [Acidobacteriales bacterium]|nr:hypothetical protein [Terriglobales bacterium]